MFRVTQKGVWVRHGFSLQVSGISRHAQGMPNFPWPALRIWFSPVQLSLRDAPASCTSSLRVGPTREAGRPTPLEEARTFHKKREVWGRDAREGSQKYISMKSHLEISLGGSKSLPAFWKLSAAVEAPGVRGHPCNPMGESTSLF